jgi:DNA-binding MarR family transcriptional regulator
VTLPQQYVYCSCVPTEIMESLLEAAAEICHGVTRLGRRLQSERLGASLSANKLNVLSHLISHGLSTPGQVAAADQHQPQSLMPLLADLESSGLIRRTRSESDGRSSLLEITQLGRNALTQDTSHRDAWLASALSAHRC